MSIDTKKVILDWGRALVIWAITGLAALYTTSQVSKAQIDTLTQWKAEHVAQHKDEQKETVTKDVFNQFKDDLNKRLDRIENKLDKH